MSRIMNVNNLKLNEVSTIKNYVDYLYNKGIKTSRQTIHYQLKKTDNLDYCEWQGMKLVIMNDRAKKFNLNGV